MNVIVLGENHNNALGLIRSLGEKGHIVYLLLFKGMVNYVAKSRYVKRTILVNTKEELSTQIISICGTLDSRPVLFCTSDNDASYVNDHYDELSQHCFLEGGIGVNKYREKDISNQLAIECGFLLPKTWIINNKDVSYVNMTYPVIVKANNSIHGGKKFLQKIESPAKLEEVVSEIDEQFFPIQVQEYIEKEYELMILGCSLSEGSEIVASVAQKKIRFYPNEYNAGSFSKSLLIDSDTELVSLRSKIKSYMENIHYEGLFSAEFVYANGSYYFLEVNLRNDGTSYLSTSCGINLPNLLCRYFEDKTIGIIGDYSPGYYMVNISDFGNVLKKRVSLCQWLKDFHKATCYSHYNKKDVLPYLFFIVSFILEKCKRLICN